MALQLRKRGPMDRYAYRQVEDSDEEEERAAIVQHCSGKNGSGGLSTLPMRFGAHSLGSQISKGLCLELALKDYSRHQQKPKAMFTFQCLKVHWYNIVTFTTYRNICIEN